MRTSVAFSSTQRASRRLRDSRARSRLVRPIRETTRRPSGLIAIEQAVDESAECRLNVAAIRIIEIQAGNRR
jgi:hypothetical protein